MNAPSRSRLPKLSAILAFETAARTGSLARAADSLALTAAAVSQQIRQLEQHLGIQLFTRAKSGVTLTEQGADYLAYVQEAFETLRVAQQHVDRQRGQETLTIFALPALASKWLNPAIGDWLARQPQLDIRLHATHAAVDFAASAADFALCFGDQDYPLLEKVQLFQDGVQPVCSPQRQAAGDWTRQPLIHVDWGKESQFLPGWHEWFTAAGLPPPQRRGLTYNLTSLAIDAAVAGHGILLGQQSLIQRELANGTLVPLAETVLPLSKPYYVVYPQRTLDKPKAAEFLAWLQNLAPPNPGGLSF
ncbi:DNA-binding transcriptional regulator [Serratia plymuthica]|uniref:LysR family transcriptional regulator n=1 Tax=Serratia plymuthica TaxID=82996 RepID=A0A7T2SUF0_SERPL|nr:LysR substrate-binding domain-containing protein [Serratia plymuthica]KYQ94882.1 DNA-binding transcriptional regulator [Serratia plymuthica]QPS21879.1 LysR family transcriptional regulator [Serratia plymuthica]QPS63490.1 LysR family transcriptional regulator [Serratia plymuthica]RKS64147.1 LysR family glycine cleavage system transcriptional activator [Serratia plymuthica]CAI2439469.1 Gcv operon activator [Serratia plymuthica]